MYNKTTLFCLGMIKPDFSKQQYKKYFANAYLYVNTFSLNNEIALHYKNIPETTEGSHDVISLQNNEYLVIYPIEKEHIENFKRFKKGEYSKFTTDLKEKIGRYFGYNSKCYYATIKHLSLKSELEKKLNVKISKDAEFYSVYDKNQETFNINNND